MPSSNNTIVRLSRDELISSALRKISVIGEGQAANATQLSEGQEALNLIIGMLRTEGMQVWKRVEYTIPFVTGQRAYSIGIGESTNTPYPTKLYQARIRLGTTGTPFDAEIVENYNFNLLPSTATGSPVNVNYKPEINKGTVTVWPTPDASVPSGSAMLLTYQAPFDIFTTGTETADFPQEWELALVYQLALVLADEYSIPIQDKQWLERLAIRYTQMAADFSKEEGSIFFHPERNR